MSSGMSRKITFYSIFMTMLMVVYHFQGGTIGDMTADSAALTGFRNLVDFFGSFAMAYFFMTSGFLLYNNAAAEGEISRKLKSRVRTLLVPFLLWNTIVLLMMIVRLRGGLPVHTVGKFIMGFTITPFVGAFWYIFWILVLMLPAPLLVKSKAALIVIAAATFVFNAFDLFPAALRASEWIGTVERAARYLPCYFLGAYIGLAHPQLIGDETRYRPAARIAAGAVLLCGLSFTAIVPLSAAPTSMTIPLRFTYITFLVVLPAAGWVMLPSRVFDFPMGTPWRISFFIYATHNSILIPLLWNILLPYIGRYADLAPLFDSAAKLIAWQLFIPAVVYMINLCVVLLMKRLRMGKLCELLSGGRV